WYGKTAESRIADPADPTRIFTWLICESDDGKGNAIVYGYKAESSDAVDVTQIHERNRTDVTRSANRPRILCAAEADRDPQRAFEQPLHHEPRQTTDDRQLGNQGRELRAKLVHVLGGERRDRDRLAGGTEPSMAAVLGNVRGDCRQLGDLMLPRLLHGVARVQAASTPTALRRNVISDRVHLPRWQQLAMMSGISKL